MKKPYSIPVYHVHLVRERSMRLDQAPIVTTPAAAYRLLKPYFEHHDREEFVSLLLDTQSQVIGIVPVSLGTLTATLVGMREAFKPALLHNAAAVMFAHNHPSSGDPSPSKEDKLLTARLLAAGYVLDIYVQDHVIIGERYYYSCRYQRRGGR